MEAILSEMPLVAFTACTLTASGAYASRCLAMGEGGATDSPKRGLQHYAPLAIALVGLAASFAHLSSPFNAVHALSGIGSSPMSNEIAATILFLTTATIGAALGAREAGGKAEKALTLAAGAAGLLLSAMVGLAYVVETIPSWDSPLTVVEAIGFALCVGAALEAWLSAASKPLTFTVVTGAAIACAALAAHVASVAAMDTAFVSGLSLVQPLIWPTAVVVTLSAGGVLTSYLALKKGSRGLSGASFAMLFVALLAARLVFYAMQLGVAL